MAGPTARWTVCLSWLVVCGTMRTSASLKTEVNSLMNASGNVGSTTWAHYSFENTLSDTSGNGQHLVSGSSWSPTYVAGVSGQAVYLNSASYTFADSSSSWLKGPVISSAGVSGQFFEISFYLAMVSQGMYHGEFLLAFASTSDSTDAFPLLRKEQGGGDLSFGPSRIVVLSAANVWTSAWHAVKLSTADPCSSSTWTLDFDGTTYSAESVDSICGRELHLNRHCWDGGQSCSSRINMMIDEMVITGGVANPPTPSPTSSPTPSPTDSDTITSESMNGFGEAEEVTTTEEDIMSDAAPAAAAATAIADSADGPPPLPLIPPMDPTGHHVVVTPDAWSQPAQAAAQTQGADTGVTTISAVGDPHLQNVHGQRFDLMKKGTHILIQIPRGESARSTLLRVVADASRLGRRCADIYFQRLNVTGAWADQKQRGGFHYESRSLINKTSTWLGFGKVDLKITRGRTREGVEYLNFYARHLGRAGFVVGGLLGEDDHTDATTPSVECLKRLSLHRPSARKRIHAVNEQNSSAVSVAVASFK